MKLSDASITTILGMRGCGKSTLTHILAKKFRRRIVFDFVGEWDGPFLYANSFDEFANLYRENFHTSHYTIVVRFKFGTPAEQIIETETKIVTLIYQTGKESGLDTCIIFEEAQFYFPNTHLHPVNLHLLTTGRHAYINILANTQRPATISKLLVSQSHDVYIGQIFEMNDIAYLRDSVGDVAFQARELQKLEFIHYPIGNPSEISIIDLK